MTSELSELLDLANDAARAGAQELASRYRTTVDIEAKSGPLDLVSEADWAAQEAILEVIQSHRRSDGYLAEERGLSAIGDSGYTWVVDPLDGTTNYLHGHNDWAVSIGVLSDKTPVLGVVLDVTRDITYRAAHSMGAWRDSERIRVHPQVQLDGSLIEFGLSYVQDRREAQWQACGSIIRAGALVRNCGSAALSLVRVAEGATDAYLEDDIEIWDWVAGVVLVNEAGGVWQRQSGSTGSAGVLAASTIELSDQIAAATLL